MTMPLASTHRAATPSRGLPHAAAPQAGWWSALPRRDGAVAQAEALLAQGDAEAAAEALDVLAQAGSGDVDAGVVEARAWLQRGAYGRALTVAARLASRHAANASALTCYAWLLAIGGEEAAAARVGALALRLHPALPVVRQVARCLAAGGPVDVPLDAPRRYAPYARAADAAAAALPHVRVAGTAVVVGDGGHALALLAEAPAEGVVRLRNALGASTAATVEHFEPGNGLALLALAAPIGASAIDALEWAADDPFAGSVGHAVAFHDDADGAPAWPWLHGGFLGRSRSATPWRELGIDLPPSARGAVVFDAAGQLAGLARRGADGSSGWLAASALRGASGSDACESVAAPTVHHRRQAAAAEVYERALPWVMQVLVDR